MPASTAVRNWLLQSASTLLLLAAFACMYIAFSRVSNSSSSFAIASLGAEGHVSLRAQAAPGCVCSNACGPCACVRSCRNYTEYEPLPLPDTVVSAAKAALQANDELLRRLYRINRTSQLGQRTVVLAGDNTQAYYSWFLPITALIWRRLGWNVHVFVVEWPRPHAAAAYIEKWLAVSASRVQNLRGLNDSGGRRRETYAQSARFLVGATDMAPEMLAMVSDADMWPLRPDFFNANTAVPGKDIFILNPTKSDDMYGVCYVAMPVRLWRETYNVNNSRGVKHSLQDFLETNLFQKQPPPDKLQQFWFDQVSLRRNIDSWKEFPDRVHKLDDRDPILDPWDRLDRLKWQEYSVGDPFIEAHVLTPGYTVQNYARIRRLLLKLLSSEEMEWVDAYATGFCHYVACLGQVVPNRPNYHPAIP